MTQAPVLTRKPKPAPLLSEFGPTLEAFLMVQKANLRLTRPWLAGVIAVSDWLERIGRPISRRRTTIRIHGLLLIAHWLGTPDAPESVERAARRREEIGQQHAASRKAAADRVAGIVREKPGTRASEHQLQQLDRLNRRLAEERSPDERAKIAKERSELLAQIERRGSREYAGRRRAELATLEALRGGEIAVEEVVVDVPIVTDGVVLRRLGEIVTTPEVVTKIKATARDGLETLATAHLTAAGELRKLDDGKTLMKPVFTGRQLAALKRYRGLFLERREVSLRAVDATEAGGDRTPFNVNRSMTLERMVSFALQEKRDDEAGRSFARAEAYVSRMAGRDALKVLRAVAGEGYTIRSLAPGRRKAIRYTKALLSAADVLADRFGMAR